MKSKQLPHGIRACFIVFGFSVSFFSTTLKAQTIFWSDDFDTAGATTNNHGIGWTMGGTSDTFMGTSNEWWINTSALCTSGNKLYVHAIGTYGGPDNLYLSDVNSDLIAESPAISTVGMRGITMDMTWRSNGEGSGGLDYGLVGYSTDSGASYIWLPTHYSGQTTCVTTTGIAFPASCEDITGFRIAFRFLSNTTHCSACDPPFNVDDIVVKGTACPTYYRDADGDGFGNKALAVQACSAPVGYVENNTDCDDSDKTTYPRAPEACDNKDNDCDGKVDEGCPITTWKLAGNTGATASSSLGTINYSPIDIITSDVVRIYISTNGKVGIGTSSPLTPLHVVGFGSFGNRVTRGNATRALNLADTAAIVQVLRVDPNNAPAVELISRTSADGTNVAYWDFYAQPSDGSFRIRDRQGGSSGLDRLTISHTYGNVGVGTTSPNASAVLELSSVSKGLLVPSMTQVQRNNIVSSPQGLLIFQTDNTPGFYYYDGGWKLLNSSVATLSSASHTSSNNTTLQQLKDEQQKRWNELTKLKQTFDELKTEQPIKTDNNKE